MKDILEETGSGTQFTMRWDPFLPFKRREHKSKQKGLHLGEKEVQSYSH
jgi:hypothetical protein